MRKLLVPRAPRWFHQTTHPNPETVWLFDMDNTLHDCSQGIFNAMHQRMTSTIAHLLDVDFETANQYRNLYWKRYGATVIGMERHHNVDPHQFLALSHAFDAPPLIRAESGLARKFRLLQGRKIILTNAPLDYARTVLSCLGILHQFEALWTINHMHLQQKIRPKPSLALMRQVLARLNVPAHQVVLVEDTLKNLKAARQVGMRTVHVHHAHTPFSAPDRPAGLLPSVQSTSKQLSGTPNPLMSTWQPETAATNTSTPETQALRLNRPAYVDMRVNSLGKLLLKRRFRLAGDAGIPGTRGLAGNG